MRRFKITSLLVGVLALAFLTFGNANAKAPEPRPTFDNVTITAALHAGGFVNAWTQHIDLLPKIIKPNWIGKNSCFIWLYEHASMRDKGRFYHRIEKIEENLKRLAE